MSLCISFRFVLLHSTKTLVIKINIYIFCFFLFFVVPSSLVKQECGGGVPLDYIITMIIAK